MHLLVSPTKHLSAEHVFPVIIVYTFAAIRTKGMDNWTTEHNKQRALETPPI